MRGKFRKRCKWAYSNQLRRFVCDPIPVHQEVKSPAVIPKIEIPSSTTTLNPSKSNLLT